MDKQKKKKKFRMDVRTMVLCATSIPLLTACVILTFISSLTIREGLEDKILEVNNQKIRLHTLELDNKNIECLRCLFSVAYSIEEYKVENGFVSVEILQTKMYTARINVMHLRAELLL